MAEKWFRKINLFISICSGEFWLYLGPNGGTIVVLRTIWASAFIYTAGIAVKLGCDPTQPGISLGAIWLNALIHFRVLGAILAGSYTVFYSRYAAQWKYLADLYNDIKKAETQMPKDKNGKQALREWKAGFLEDALELHLGTKPMFASIIKHWTKDNEIVKCFKNDTLGGEQRYHSMMAHVIEVCKQYE